MARTVDIHVVGHELPVVFVGREHVGGHALAAETRGHGADNVVGLEAVYLQDGYAVGFENALDDRHGELDVFRCLLALGLILGECLMAERPAVVEGHTDVGGTLLGEHLVERVHESQHSRGVESFGVDAGTAQQRIVGAVDEGVGVQEK